MARALNNIPLTSDYLCAKYTIIHAASFGGAVLEENKDFLFKREVGQNIQYRASPPPYPQDFLSDGILQKIFSLVNKFEKEFPAESVDNNSILAAFRKDPGRVNKTKESFVRQGWTSDKINQLIEKNNVEQVLVLGMGIHGYAMLNDFAGKYPKIKFAGVDLPGTVNFIKDAESREKNRPKNLSILDSNLSRENLHYVVNKAGIDAGKKTVVISIGLNSYLEQYVNEKLFKQTNDIFGKESFSLFTVVDKFDLNNPSHQAKKEFYENIGEPLKWQAGREEITDLLKQSGNGLLICNPISKFIQRRLGLKVDNSDPQKTTETFLCMSKTMGKEKVLVQEADNTELVMQQEARPSKKPRGKDNNPNQLTLF